MDYQLYFTTPQNIAYYTSQRFLISSRNFYAMLSITNLLSFII